MKQIDLTELNRQVQPRSLADEAYFQLLKMIQCGDLSGGTLLQERPLAEALGISRTPVREALNKLEIEGFAVRGGRGLLTVKEPSVREYLEILQLRRLLEGEAAAFAAERLEIETIDRLMADVAALIDDPHPTPERHHSVDDAVHGTIAGAANNAFLTRLIMDLRLKTYVFDLNRVPERFKPGCHEHLGILSALRERDVELARQRMSEHIDNVRLSIIKRLTAL